MPKTHTAPSGKPGTDADKRRLAFVHRSRQTAITYLAAKTNSEKSVAASRVSGVCLRRRACLGCLEVPALTRTHACVRRHSRPPPHEIHAKHTDRYTVTYNTFFFFFSSSFFLSLSYTHTHFYTYTFPYTHPSPHPRHPPATPMNTTLAHCNIALHCRPT